MADDRMYLVHLPSKIGMCVGKKYGYYWDARNTICDVINHYVFRDLGKDFYNELSFVCEDDIDTINKQVGIGLEDTFLITIKK